MILAAALLTVASPMTDDESTIRLLRARHNAALAARDLAGAMAIVAPDAVLTGGNGGTMRGAKAIREAWRGQFAVPGYGGYVRTPASIEVGESDGVLRAAEEGRWTVPSGAARLRGRYLVHWRKLAEGWRTVAEVYVTLGCDGSGC